MALDHVLTRRAVDELNGGVMADLQAFGKRRDGRRLPVLQRFHLKKQHVLLWLYARGTGGDLSHADEAPDLITQVTEGLVVHPTIRYAGRQLPGSRACDQNTTTPRYITP